MKSTTSTTLPPVFVGTNVSAPRPVADSVTSSLSSPSALPPKQPPLKPREGSPAAQKAPEKPAPGWLGNVLSVGRRMSFEVWLEGVTDSGDPEAWRGLEVQVHSSLNGAPEKTQAVPPAGRIGNNLKFELDLTRFDPFGSALSHALPTVMRFYFTVNDVRLDDGGKPFEATFGGG